jgi:hypothetical protein
MVSPPLNTAGSHLVMVLSLALDTMAGTCGILDVDHIFQ